MGRAIGSKVLPLLDCKLVFETRSQNTNIDPSYIIIALGYFVMNDT
jgi:hypothetical protein